MNTSQTLPARPQASGALDRATGSFKSFFKKLADEPLGMFGFAVLLLLVIVAILAPWIAPYSATSQNLSQALQPPSFAHWAGTDEFGRDILSRLIYGTRITIQTVLAVSLIVGPIGLLIGIVAGFVGDEPMHF